MIYSWWSVYCRVTIVNLKIGWIKAFHRKSEHHIAILPSAIRYDERFFVVISAHIGSQSKDLFAFIHFVQSTPSLKGPLTFFIFSLFPSSSSSPLRTPPCSAFSLDHALPLKLIQINASFLPAGLQQLFIVIFVLTSDFLNHRHQLFQHVCRESVIHAPV